MDRKTNSEIAADLFGSQEIVETYLRNIFDEVDVSSRVELVGRLRGTHGWHPL